MTNEQAIRRLEDLQRLYLGNEKFTADIEAIGIAIEALQKSSRTPLSKGQIIKADLQSAYDCGYNCGYVDAMKKILRTGKWIDIQYFKKDDTYYRPKCPFCSIEPKDYSNYCPNCGADMRESEGGET